MAILKPKLNNDQNTNLNDKYELLQPWSVPILRTKLPKKIFDSFYAISESTLKNPNSKPYGHHLVGQIETEKQIDVTLLDNYGVNAYFKHIVSRFIIECKSQMLPDKIEKVKKNTYDIDIQSMWIVSQKPGEYNPLHVHSNCQISGVLYLKIPNMLPSIKGDVEGDDGTINFYSAGTRDLQLSAPSYQPYPKVGDLYIFGAQQHHVVYPYRSSDVNAERRSISFNVVYKDMPGNYDFNQNIRHEHEQR